VSIELLIFVSSLSQYDRAPRRLASLGIDV